MTSYQQKPRARVVVVVVVVFSSLLFFWSFSFLLLLHWGHGHTPCVLVPNCRKQAVLESNCQRAKRGDLRFTIAGAGRLGFLDRLELLAVLDFLAFLVWLTLFAVFVHRFSLLACAPGTAPKDALIIPFFQGGRRTF